jgi:hypothetical protein
MRQKQVPGRIAGHKKEGVTVSGSLKTCRARTTVLTAVIKLKGADNGSTHERSVKCLQNIVFNFGDRGILYLLILLFFFFFFFFFVAMRALFIRICSYRTKVLQRLREDVRQKPAER